jgi:hypothetical protein
MLVEMSEFAKSDGVCARVGGMRLEEFGFYAADAFKNLERRAQDSAGVGRKDSTFGRGARLLGLEFVPDVLD